jgi:hypothetical protein
MLYIKKLFKTCDVIKSKFVQAFITVNLLHLSQFVIQNMVMGLTLHIMRPFSIYVALSFNCTVMSLLIGLSFSNL